jgi:hypothetical protein
MSKPDLINSQTKSLPVLAYRLSFRGIAGSNPWRPRLAMSIDQQPGDRRAWSKFFNIVANEIL